jgi:arylsulfatase A-like enzyme/Flp pilus assembly protein TadD
MIGWLATAAGFGAVPAQKKPSPPDVFLITIDTLRADHVRCYGDEGIQTPALDGLAKDGVRFAHAFTPSPITNTSHTTILTGLLPSSHGVTDFAVPLAATHPTWAELLKPKGYHTAAFIGAVILDSKSLAPGLDRGFDFYDNFPERAPTKSRWGRVERRGADVVEHAETWLAAHPAGPHFVWVHLYDPHDPYEPPAPYAETYKDRLYDGEIAYADSVLANFVAYLKKRGWYDNSIVIVVGDHGEGLGEHHEDTHGIFLYDSTIHVPLIMKLPAGARAAKVLDAQVRTTDILPTVLDLLRVTPPEKLDGKSLTPYFAGSETADRTAIGETDYPLRFGWAPLRSVRAEGFKFIEAPRPELYDLHSDPGELKNGYEPGNTTVQRFRGMLAQVKPGISGQTSSPGADIEGARSDLQALGYTSGSNAAGASAAALPDPKDKIEEQNLLHVAMLATDDDREADARAALEKVLLLDSKSPTALRQLGELELKAGDYAKAADHLKRAREVRPDDSTAAFYEGQAREKMRDLAGARDALEASLKLTPGQLPARLLLGLVYLRLKDPKAAEDQFEAALLVQADSVEAQIGVAQAQILEGDTTAAIAQLEPLSKAQPENAEVFQLLAQVYRALGRFDEAEKADARAQTLREKQAKP